MAGPFPWAPVPTPAANGGLTRSQSALYAQIKLSGQVIGLAQRVRWEGQSGNHPVRGLGEAISENAPGDLFYTGTISNFAIRKRRLMDLVKNSHPSLQSANAIIDYRTFAFDLELDFTLLNGAGDTTIESSHETLTGVWLQTWGSEFGDPSSLRMEDLTFWAQGYTYTVDGDVKAQHGNTSSAQNANKPPAPSVSGGAGGQRILP